jgi:hypothetical protein
MEYREKDGKKFTDCTSCDNLKKISENSFECISPKTGNHRYDTLFKEDSGVVFFPEWCPLLRTDTND